MKVPGRKRGNGTMKLFVSVVSVFAVLTLSVTVGAHHSFNTFFTMEKTVEIEGMVKSFKLVSPHSEMMVEVTEPDGTVALWRITARTGAVNARRAGWRPEDFIGHTVKVEGNPARREGATAMAAGVVTFPDGKIVCLGGCPGVPEQ